VHRTRCSCQKFDEDFFQILWASQKTQTLKTKILFQKAVGMRFFKAIFPFSFQFLIKAKIQFTQKMWSKNKILNMDNLCKVISLIKDGTELANRLLLDIG
jgi:hypothetical protein